MVRNVPKLGHVAPSERRRPPPLVTSGQQLPRWSLAASLAASPSVGRRHPSPGVAGARWLGCSFGLLHALVRRRASGVAVRARGVPFPVHRWGRFLWVWCPLEGQCGFLRVQGVPVPVHRLCARWLWSVGGRACGVVERWPSPLSFRSLCPQKIYMIYLHIYYCIVLSILILNITYF